MFLFAVVLLCPGTAQAHFQTICLMFVRFYMKTGRSGILVPKYYMDIGSEIVLSVPGTLGNRFGIIVQFKSSVLGRCS